MAQAVGAEADIDYLDIPAFLEKAGGLAQQQQKIRCLGTGIKNEASISCSLFPAPESYWPDLWGWLLLWHGLSLVWRGRSTGLPEFTGVI